MDNECDNIYKKTSLDEHNFKSIKENEKINIINMNDFEDYINDLKSQENIFLS